MWPTNEFEFETPALGAERFNDFVTEVKFFVMSFMENPLPEQIEPTV